MISERLIALIKMVQSIIKIKVNVTFAQELVVKRHRVYIIVHKIKRIYILRKI